MDRPGRILYLIDFTYSIRLYGVTSSRIVRQLQLQPYRQGGISGIGGATGSNIYLIHMLVPTGDVVTSVEVMESDFEDIDVLIGFAIA